MIKITENTIETFAIELLEGLGYQYQYGHAMAHDAEQPERVSFEQVLLLQRLGQAVNRKVIR